MRFSTSAALVAIAAFAGQAFANFCTEDFDMGSYVPQEGGCTSINGQQRWNCAGKEVIAFRMSQEVYISTNVPVLIEARCADDHQTASFLQCDKVSWGWVRIACPGTGNVELFSMVKA
ncbi:hypothetical protein E4U42_003006 [Claviceps africana]|uniref:Uncharacterized protein n=1 Tax=Claviceps africana TaxID=83212 RepID=A0A8K0JDG6_9HYPO|nr:hypothetical protein E4U42_003006 [Claviceps africana]